ncbi:MAG TPA: hypothetical protein VM432_04575 [Bdellovibrionales bacterium]|nr:hypothetical protein [Bdellovibrionales bacterium]
MKSVTEFANFTLSAALKARAALVAEGKTPEEIQAGLGETFKFEAEKLTHFVNSLEVAAQNPENLKRVLVVSLNEGERAPAKAIQVEAFHYVPDFHVTARPAQTEDKDKKGGRGGKGKGRGGDRGQKESPWGLSPEQKAEKKKAQAAAAAEKRKQP